MEPGLLFATVLGSVVKKSPVVLLAPSIRVSPKRGHFAVKEDDLFLISLLFGSPICMNDFDHVEKKPLNLSKWSFLSPKTPEVGAHRVTLHRIRKNKVITLNTNRREVFVASKQESPCPPHH